MPTITVNKKELSKLIGKKLPTDQLKDRISMLGTDLEGIQGDEIKVEIFPNRPDLLSTQGLARALASLIGTKPSLKEYSVKKSNYQVIVHKSVTMRPFTACAIVKNLSLNDQKITDLMQLQEKLATTHGRNRKKSAYGIYPLNSIQFPINYIAKDPKKIEFQPLGFDSEIKAHKVTELHPKGRAYVHLTESWNKYPFFIDANKNVMCMLPFTNSEDTGKVTESTTDVFVECTGIDQINVNIALNILVTTLADMGGSIESVTIKYPKETITTPNLQPKEIILNKERVNKLLGINLSENDASKWLERMGFGIKKNKNNLIVQVPAYRNDILHQVDLAEDIAIAYGYENFEEIIPNVATIAKRNPQEVFAEKIRSLLIGLSLLEVKNFHLIKQTDLTTQMCIKEEVITLCNSLGDHNTLRNSLIPSLLKTLSINAHHEYPQNIFEIGRVFHKISNENNDTGIYETQKLAIAVCSETADFTTIRQIIDSISLHLNINFSVKETKHPSYFEGRVANIKFGKNNIGILGELHPQVLDNWQIKMPISVIEIDLEKLLENSKP